MTMNRLQQVRAEIARAAAENAAAKSRARAAAAAAGGAATNGKPKAVKAGRGGSVDRWTQFNMFMDVIAPRLTLAERAVWLALFRHARGGVCETSERQLMAATSCVRNTVRKSIRRLIAVRLIGVVYRSTVKGRPSKYALATNPAACLGRLGKPGDSTP